MSKSLEQARADARSPHEHCKELNAMSDEVGFWLETSTDGRSWQTVEVFAHGPEWVCIKPEGFEGDPYWAQWANLVLIRVVAQ
jgi:hypothetical protein